MEVNGQHYCRVSWPAEQTKTLGLSAHQKMMGDPSMWTVTMTHAGLRIATFLNYDRAMEFADRLGKWDGWNEALTADDVPDPVRRGIKKLIAEMSGTRREKSPF